MVTFLINFFLWPVLIIFFYFIHKNEKKGQVNSIVVTTKAMFITKKFISVS